MAGEWHERKLGEVITLKRGYDLASTTRRPGSVPIVSSSGVSGFHDTAMANAPGVVTGRYGTIGEVFYVRESFWPLNTTLYVSDFKGSNPRFVSYYLKTLNFSAYSDKAAVPGINRNDLHDADVLWPSLNEQIAIASILESLDDKIDLNRKMAVTLEDMARALFKSWFVDFDPVHAKGEGRETGLPADIAALFPDSFDDEGLPEGWVLSAPTEFFDIVGGGTPNTKNPEFWDGEIAWYSIADAPRFGAFVTETEKSISPKGLSASPARIVDAGTTIISARGTVGKLAIAGREMAFNQSCYGLVPRDGFGNGFVYSIAVEIVENLKIMAHGAVFSTITRDTFLNLSLPAPPVGSLVTRAFEHLIKSSFDQMLTLAEENSMLTALRDTLLPRLLSGELRVANAADSIAAA